MTCEQSTAPEDTRAAREEGLRAEDFPAKRVCLTAREIRELDDTGAEWVELPEWGVGAGVYVRRATGAERNAWEQSYTDEALPDAPYEHMAVQFACDEEGKSIFTEADLDWLLQKCSAAVRRIGEAAFAKMGMTTADIEDSVKN